MRAGQSPAVGREVLDDDTRTVEDLLLGVRMADGLRVAGLTAEQHAQVEVLVADGLGSVGAGRLASPGRVGCSPMRWCADWSAEVRGRLGRDAARVPPEVGQVSGGRP